MAKTKDVLVKPPQGDRIVDAPQSGKAAGKLPTDVIRFLRDQLQAQAQLAEKLEQESRRMKQERQESEQTLQSLLERLAAAGNQVEGSPLKVKVVIYEAEEGGYWAEVPALPGCATEGETRAELLANLREAIAGYLLCTPGNFELQEGGKEEEIEF